MQDDLADRLEQIAERMAGNIDRLASSMDELSYEAVHAQLREDLMAEALPKHYTDGVIKGLEAENAELRAELERKPTLMGVDEIIKKRVADAYANAAKIAREWPCLCDQRYPQPVQNFHGPDCESAVGFDIAAVIEAEGSKA